MTEHQLCKPKTIRKWLTRKTFDRLQNMTREEIMDLPPASGLCETNLYGRILNQQHSPLSSMTSLLRVKRILLTSSSGSHD